MHNSPLGVSISNQVRLAYLYLQSRRAGWAALYLTGIAAFVAGLRFGLREMGRQGGDPFTNSFDGSPVPFVLLFVPLAAAMVIGVAVHSPFGEMERTTSRRQPPLRLGHAGGLLLCGVAILSLLALTWDGDSERVFLRNLAGLTGVGLLTAPVFGARLSWVPSLSYGIAAFWVGSFGEAPKWAWPMRPMDDNLAWGIALVLLAAGLAALVGFGARDTADETP